MLSSKDFRAQLRRWYRRHGRDLPWRRTRDPYAVLVSELMLQQTQVATVLPYYNEWLRRFPDSAALARASEHDVLHAWQGLGYYNRARHLRAAAKIVQDRHAGIFPSNLDLIRQLPGVGRYTANAVATFAFDQSVPIVEANTARLIARLFDMREPVDTRRGHEKLWRHAAALLPRRGAASHNSALLDLGALICTARAPKCGICPVKKFCLVSDPEILPIKKPRPRTKRLIERHAFVFRKNKILLEQSAKRWRGMWILPALSGTRSRYRALHTAQFPFTNHQITLAIFPAATRNRKQNEKWFSVRALDSIPIPSPHRRAIVALLR